MPSKLTRYGLSQVINHLLGLGESLLVLCMPSGACCLPFSHIRKIPFPLADPVRPFDFLINGELVRLSLEKFLLARNISAVKASPSLPLTVPDAVNEHEPWISS